MDNKTGYVGTPRKHTEFLAGDIVETVISFTSHEGNHILPAGSQGQVVDDNGGRLETRVWFGEDGKSWLFTDDLRLVGRYEINMDHVEMALAILRSQVTTKNQYAINLHFQTIDDEWHEQKAELAQLREERAILFDACKHKAEVIDAILDRALEFDNTIGQALRETVQELDDRFSIRGKQQIEPPEPKPAENPPGSIGLTKG